MKKFVLKYGLISGAVSAALMITTGLSLRNSTSFENAAIYGFAGMVLSMLFVFLGIKAYRDTSLNGQITFGHAFQTGLFITIISCACYAVSWLFLYNILLPDLMEKYAAYSIEQLRNSGATAAAIHAHETDLEKYKEMYQNPLMIFMEPFPIGLLVTLISSFILKGK
jgi:hypothetical protein